MKRIVLSFTTILSICLSAPELIAQYCIPPTRPNCGRSWITNVKIGTINNTSLCSSGGYGDYSATSTTLAAGLTYTIIITGNYDLSQLASVFADWNNDGDFLDANELAVSNLAIPDNGTRGSGTITVPANATGSLRLRIVSTYAGHYNANTSCSSATHGETEDYTINICSGSPDNDGDGYTVCQGDCNDNNPAVYPGATEIPGNNIDDNCDGVIDGPSYCKPTGDGKECQNMWIKNVSLETINNNSGCSSGGYGDYSFLSTPLTPGSTYSILITSANGYQQKASVFIDWNEDGDFADANEVVATHVVLPDNNTPGTATFTVPANATGSHRLRVASDLKDFYTSNNSCYSGKHGETEDYTVTTAPPCETPSITCPVPVVVQCANDVPDPNVNTVTATSNCDVPTVTWEGDVINNQTCANRYTITRTYKATNSAGSSTCTQMITVNDQTAPAISSIPADITVSCASDVPAADDNAVTATDNCGGTVTVSHNDAITPGSCANRYSIARTYIATDECGNASSQIQTIAVDDQQPPVISCPGPVTVQCASDVPAPDITSVSAVDNCNGTVNVTWDGDVISNQTCTNSYTITRTYKATDACGNNSMCTQTINVDDDTKPEITCPGNMTVAPITLAGTVVIYSAPTATDNCGTVTVVQTAGKPSGSTFPIGTTTNTFVATDACGNTSECSFTITVSNPYCDNNPNSIKVYVCHGGKTNCISVNALEEHMAHGDYLGPCSGSTTTNVEAPSGRNMEEVTAFEVNVSPNPSATDFRITVKGNTNERIRIFIKDGAGKAVLTATGIQSNAPVAIGGNLRSGIYFAEIIQGANRKTVRLVKIN